MNSTIGYYKWLRWTTLNVTDRGFQATNLDDALGSEPTVKKNILTEMPWLFSAIHHFHIDHNEACLPPRILRNHYLRFLLGRL